MVVDMRDSSPIGYNFLTCYLSAYVIYECFGLLSFSFCVFELNEATHWLCAVNLFTKHVVKPLPFGYSGNLLISELFALPSEY